MSGVFTDLCVGIAIHLLHLQRRNGKAASLGHAHFPPCLPHVIGGDPVLDEPREVSLVFLLVLLHQVPHVVGHMTAVEAFPESVSVQFLVLRVITNESLRTGGRRVKTMK